MNVKRLYFGLLGLIIIMLIALVGGTYAANNLLSQRADTLTALKAKQLAQVQEQLKLEQAKREIAKYTSLQKTASSIVPEDKDQAEAVRELVNIAAANGITLGSITFPSSTLGTSASSASAAASASAALPSPNSASNKLSQLLPVKGLSGVYQLTITVTSDVQHSGSYAQVISFLSGLEHDRRTAQVNSLSLQPAVDNPQLVNFTLTINEYIKP